VVVNAGGGLLACGHPFGATGIRQAYEIFIQLRGEAGERQVADAKIALTHNLSGLGEHHLLIYGRES
jgi:acetyl-CoA C-acetyltransferase